VFLCNVGSQLQAYMLSQSRRRNSEASCRVQKFHVILSCSEGSCYVVMFRRFMLCCVHKVHVMLSCSEGLCYSDINAANVGLLSRSSISTYRLLLKNICSSV
jgi:hypothetical protein